MKRRKKRKSKMRRGKIERKKGGEGSVIDR